MKEIEEATVPRDIVAEFHKNPGGRFELFSLNVVDKKFHRTYDVDWSRTYGYIFHESGAGQAPVEVSGVYWTNKDLEVKEFPCTLISPSDKAPYRSKETRRIRARNRTRRLRKLPKAFRLDLGQDLLGWLFRHGIEDETVWCSACRDRLPSESLCEHCWWCEKSFLYSTPDERCECGDREKCESA